MSKEIGIPWQPRENGSFGVCDALLEDRQKNFFIRWINIGKNRRARANFRNDNTKLCILRMQYLCLITRENITKRWTILRKWLKRDFVRLDLLSLDCIIYSSCLT